MAVALTSHLIGGSRWGTEDGERSASRAGEDKVRKRGFRGFN